MRCKGRSRCARRGCAGSAAADLGQLSLPAQTAGASQDRAPQSTRQGVAPTQRVGPADTGALFCRLKTPPSMMGPQAPYLARLPARHSWAAAGRDTGGTWRSDTNLETPAPNPRRATTTAAAPLRQPLTTAMHFRMALRDSHKTACAAPRERSAPHRALARWWKEFWNSPAQPSANHRAGGKAGAGCKAAGKAPLGGMQMLPVVAALAFGLRRQAHPITCCPSAHHRPKRLFPSRLANTPRLAVHAVMCCMTLSRCWVCCRRSGWAGSCYRYSWWGQPQPCQTRKTPALPDRPCADSDRSGRPSLSAPPHRSTVPPRT